MKNYYFGYSSGSTQKRLHTVSKTKQTPNKLLRSEPKYQKNLVDSGGGKIQNVIAGKRQLRV